MASDLARAKVNFGFAPQLMTQFTPRTYEEIKRGVVDRGILIRDVSELKEVSQVTCTCIIFIMHIVKVFVCQLNTASEIRRRPRSVRGSFP